MARPSAPTSCPSRLAFREGGFAGLSHELEWSDGQLWFRESPHSHEDIERRPWQACVAPSPSDWKRLQAALERSGFFGWPQHREDPDVRDGTQWSLSLQWNGRSHSCSGSNAFPPGFDVVSRTLLALVQEPDLRYPPAFRMHVWRPYPERHLEWDGRYFSAVTYGPDPSLHEYLQPSVDAWAPILPLLRAARDAPAKEGDTTYELAFLDPAENDAMPSPRALLEGLGRELEWALLALRP